MLLLSCYHPSSSFLLFHQRRGLFISEYQSRILVGSTFSGGLLSCSLLAKNSVPDIDHILKET